MNIYRLLSSLVVLFALVVAMYGGSPQGCIVVFFSNFLALMAKADVSDEEAQSQETFGLLLIAVHAAMVIAVVSQAYLSMQVPPRACVCVCNVCVLYESRQTYRAG